ncbi:MAG TPA: hypothetical protein VMF53_04460 [Alphaproteobacteria bacterium]|nr:hypothetical protein [Alphaproteobacteria bacterium]
MGHQPEINKSSRHSKITGDFTEALILYWLSKHGFECAQIDHMGMDIIARNPTTAELMGISVKSRSRVKGKEDDKVRIYRSDIRKLETACETFACHPYFAVVVDAAPFIHCFITSATHLSTLSGRRKHLAFRMTPKDLAAHETDPEIRIFRFKYKTHRWWK